MSDKGKMKIVVSKDGPYLVFGEVPVGAQIITPNKEGMSWDWTPGDSYKPTEAGKVEGESYYRLCRCGQSKNKPFCDDTHLKIKFEGRETATRKPYDRQAEVTQGPSLNLSDAENLCAFARFCDPSGQVWNLVTEEGEQARELTIREG